MIQRILNVYSIEVIKALRQRITYAGPILIILTILVAPFAYPIDQGQTSDYGFVAYAVQLSLNILGFFLILVYCTNLLSAEVTTGTIRNTLVRPLRRSEIFLAKLLVGVTYATALAFIAGVLAWSVALVAGNMSGVHYGGEVVYTNSEMLTAYGIALIVGMLPLYTAVTYALLVAVSTRGLATSAGIAVGIWLFIDIVKYPLNIAPFFFSSFVESAWQSFLDRANAIATPNLAPETSQMLGWFGLLVEQGVITCIVSIILFLSASLYIFSRRNFT